MLLRRITKHVSDQNWFAVFIDFLIVVVGVFIGIQVANWNESLSNQDRELVYIERLIEDFETIESRLTSNITVFERAIEGTIFIRQFILENQTMTEPKNQRFIENLAHIDSNALPAWRSATYIEMQSAGDFNLIKNNLLKKALVNYDQSTEIAHVGAKKLLNSQINYVEPIIYSLIQYAPNLNVESGTDSYRIIGFDYQKMVKEPEFLSALSTMLKLQANNQVLQQNQMKLAQAVMTQLKEGAK